MRGLLVPMLLAGSMAALLAGAAVGADAPVPAERADTLTKAEQDANQQIIKDAKEGVISDVMAQKLAPEQIVDLVKHIQDKRTEERVAETVKVNPPSEAVIVPVAGCLMIVALAFIPIFLGYRAKVHQHRLMEKMVERGQTIPPYILDPPKRRMSDLKRGVLLIAAGLGTIVGLLLWHNGAWGLGFVPLIVGAGYLVVAKMEKPRGNWDQQFPIPPLPWDGAKPDSGNSKPDKAA